MKLNRLSKKTLAAVLAMAFIAASSGCKFFGKQTKPTDQDAFAISGLVGLLSLTTQNCVVIEKTVSVNLSAGGADTVTYAATGYGAIPKGGCNDGILLSGGYFTDASAAIDFLIASMNTMKAALPATGCTATSTAVDATTTALSTNKATYVTTLETAAGLRPTGNPKCLNLSALNPLVKNAIYCKTDEDVAMQKSFRYYHVVPSVKEDMPLETARGLALTYQAQNGFTDEAIKNARYMSQGELTIMNSAASTAWQYAFANMATTAEPGCVKAIEDANADLRSVLSHTFVSFSLGGPTIYGIGATFSSATYSNASGITAADSGVHGDVLVPYGACTYTYKTNTLSTSGTCPYVISGGVWVSKYPRF